MLLGAGAFQGDLPKITFFSPLFMMYLLKSEDRQYLGFAASFLFYF